MGTPDDPNTPDDPARTLVLGAGEAVGTSSESASAGDAAALGQTVSLGNVDLGTLLAREGMASDQIETVLRVMRGLREGPVPALARATKAPAPAAAAAPVAPGSRTMDLGAEFDVDRQSLTDVPFALRGTLRSRDKLSSASGSAHAFRSTLVDPAPAPLQRTMDLSEEDIEEVPETPEDAWSRFVAETRAMAHKLGESTGELRPAAKRDAPAAAPPPRAPSVPASAPALSAEALQRAFAVTLTGPDAPAAPLPPDAPLESRIAYLEQFIAARPEYAPVRALFQQVDPTGEKYRAQAAEHQRRAAGAAAAPGAPAAAPEKPPLWLTEPATATQPATDSTSAATRPAPDPEAESIMNQLDRALAKTIPGLAALAAARNTR